MDNTHNIPAKHKRTLLIIEDDELNREMLCVMLEDQYRILQAENGRVGMEVLQKHYREISLVVLDVQMPVMNGYEFLEEVKSDELLSEIPVIVATGSTRYDEEERCLDLGASDFVTKPYNRHIVLSRISNIIKLRESASTLSEIEYDELTGLYTRQAFYHHADLMLKQNPDVTYRLVISDIDNFHVVGDRYGKKVADEMLRKDVQIMLERQVEGSVCGRISDDQLVTMTWDMRGFDNNTPDDFKVIQIEGPEGIVCKLKFGVKDNLDHSIPVREHCQHTLMALNTVKHRYDKFVAYFDKSMEERLERQKVIEQSMEKALRDEQFLIYYQPKHDAQTGQLVGAEALIRWLHPEYGFMSPGEFIPIFEQTGFISEADLYAWKRTCHNIRRWTNRGLRTVPISVNCSRAGLLHGDFYSKWSEPVRAYKVQPDFLHLEITESLFAENTDDIARVLRLCRDNGIKIELDDFGTGYSSLSSLELLPLDIVKFDMSFMKRLFSDKTARIMALSVQLAQSLNLKTVAEGVETEEQLEIVRSMGVDAVQGYYYSKPLSEQDFEDYLRKFK